MRAARGHPSIAFCSTSKLCTGSNREEAAAQRGGHFFLTQRRPSLLQTIAMGCSSR